MFCGKLGHGRNAHASRLECRWRRREPAIGLWHETVPQQPSPSFQHFVQIRGRAVLFFRSFHSSYRLGSRYGVSLGSTGRLHRYPNALACQGGVDVHGGKLPENSYHQKVGVTLQEIDFDYNETLNGRQIIFIGLVSFKA
jgi:hypothetical protein